MQQDYTIFDAVGVQRTWSYFYLVFSEPQTTNNCPQHVRYNPTRTRDSIINVDCDKEPRT